MLLLRMRRMYVASMSSAKNEWNTQNAIWSRASITRNLITRVLTICHVKLTQSTSLEQKRFDLRSLSPALRTLWLLLALIVIFFFSVIVASPYTTTSHSYEVIEITPTPASNASVMIMPIAAFIIRLWIQIPIHALLGEGVCASIVSTIRLAVIVRCVGKCSIGSLGRVWRLVMCVRPVDVRGLECSLESWIASR